MRVIAGIDCGTGFTKAMVIGQTPGVAPHILGKARVKSGVNSDAAAEEALTIALLEARLRREDVDYIATTGFARYNVSFRDIQVTEITSAARGVSYLLPDASCVLDIGAQSTRAIAIANGKVKLFKSNDKCAAGSGMFIARAARYLEAPLESVGQLSLDSRHPQPISSVCAVLAESEIINHVSAGVGIEDIFRGIHESLADRAGALLRRVGMQDRITLIGGVALQGGIVKALEERLHVRVDVPVDCEYVCALGAALLGAIRLMSKRTEAAHAASVRV
jgi:(R)-2-hydroxyacyl-CoA dehydratese activating ATPase